MKRSSLMVLAAAGLALAQSAGISRADTSATPTVDNASSVQLEAQIEALQAKVNQLQAQQSQQNTDATREAQIAQVVKQVLSDAQFRSQYLDDTLQAGYNKGFFIQTPDQDFKLDINGYLQFRYTYAQATNPNNLSQYKPGPTAPAYGLSWDPGLPDTGNVSGFTFRRARIILSGNAFTPNLFYNFTGDFGGTSSTNNGGNFFMQDVYLGYKFAPWLAVRAGSFLIPFTHVEYISRGLEFPEFNPITDAFDPVRAQGVSLFGDIIPHQMDYEVNVNNGPKTNTTGNDAAFGSTTIGDNRPSFAARWEVFDSADAADFTSEPDINWTKNLEWMLGFAFLYDSQNPAHELSSDGSGAVTSEGTTGVIVGLSSHRTPGFISNYTLSGDNYRAEGDFTLHWQGLSISPVVFYQQVNDNGGTTATAGGSTQSLSAYYGTSSVGELGYYVQGGYFLVPHQWEIAASFGQLYTLGVSDANNAATYIQGGINYYLFGNNAKIQVAETYTPLAAFTDANYGTAQNTRDYITQVQFQVAF